MRPLTLAALGIVLVAIDWRIRALDMLPDPLGWVLVVVAAWRLSLGWPALAAGVAGLLSLADVVLPYRWVRVDPVTGEVVPTAQGVRRDFPDHLVWDRLSDGRTLLMLLAALVGGLTLAWFGLALFGRKRIDDPGSKAGGDWMVASLLPLLWALPQVLAPAAGLTAEQGYDPVWNGSINYIGLASTVALLVFAGSLFAHRNARWANPDAWIPSSTGTDRWGRALRRVGAPHVTRSPRWLPPSPGRPSAGR